MQFNYLFYLPLNKSLIMFITLALFSSVTYSDNNTYMSNNNGTDSLTIAKSYFEPGEDIQLSFTASPDYPDKSWIGMFRAELPHTGMATNNNHELAFRYLKKSPKGGFTYTAPTEEGAYDFRMFERHSGKEVATIQFTVAVNNSAASLKLPKKVFEPGEDITLSFTASPHYPDKSWVGMFKADLPRDGMASNNNHELAFQYLKKSSKGNFVFIAPTDEGDYDFRMFERSNGKEVATTKFTVMVNKDAASLSLPQKVYKPETKVVVSFTASAHYPDKSWIGMFKADLPHDGMASNNNHELAFQYLKKRSKGKFIFTAPKEEGDYDFRMFERSNSKEVATLKFTVNKNHKTHNNSVNDSSLTKSDTSDVEGIVDVKPTEDIINNKIPKGLKEQVETKTNVNEQQRNSKANNEKVVPAKALSSVAYDKDHKEFSQILFDGNGFGSNWEPRLETKRRAGFDDVAKFQSGMLFVDVPKDTSWGQVGLSSKKPLVWLDQFGPMAEKRLAFKIVPNKTTGFAVALSTNREYNTFVVKWVRLASKGKTVLQVFVNDGLACNPDWPTHAKPEWEQEVGNEAPSEIVLAIKPGEIDLSGKGLPEHTQKWDSLTADAGFKLHAYSFPEVYDESAQMGLKQITLENTKLSSVEPPAPLNGVEPLPTTEFFGPKTHDGWEMTPWGTYNTGNKRHSICMLDKAGFIVPHGQTEGGRNKGCDIHSRSKIINLDDRLENANYQLTAHFNPKQTQNFRIVLPTAKRGNQRWVKSISTREISLARSSTDSSLMTLDCAGYGQRDVSRDWLQNQWNGKFNITINKKWMRCSLEDGPAIKVNRTPAKSFYVYIVAPDYRYKDTDAKLHLTQLTGQWVLPHPMTAAERWRYLDDDKFNPDDFLKELVEGL